MTRNPYCVFRDALASDAVPIMIERGFRHLPTVGPEEAKILGGSRDALPCGEIALQSMAEFKRAG